MNTDATRSQSAELIDEKIIKEVNEIVEEELTQDNVNFFANKLDTDFFNLLQDFLNFNRNNQY